MQERISHIQQHTYIASSALRVQGKNKEFFIFYPIKIVWFLSSVKTLLLSIP